MEVIRLPVGKQAPIDSDCISIEEQLDGRFAVTGSLLSSEESVALVSPLICNTREAAEEEGIAWAAGCRVPRLLVSTMLRGGRIGSVDGGDSD